MTEEFQVNVIAIGFFKRQAQNGRNIKLELHAKPNKAEINFYDTTNLKTELKLLREIGINRLEKGQFVGSEAQYARGCSKDGNIEVWLFPRDDIFVGCRKINYQEDVLIPAAEAKPAVSEHHEIVTKTKIICNNKDQKSK